MWHATWQLESSHEQLVSTVNVARMIPKWRKAGSRNEAHALFPSFHFRDAFRADLRRKANHRGDEAPGNYRDLSMPRMRYGEAIVFTARVQRYDKGCMHDIARRRVCRLSKGTRVSLHGPSRYPVRVGWYQFFLVPAPKFSWTQNSRFQFQRYRRCRHQLKHQHYH